jgi:transcription elongation GreA/GreB family factor
VAAIERKCGVTYSDAVGCKARPFKFNAPIMSRAFVKESDEGAASAELPERPLSAEPNYVTPRGMQSLRARLKELQVERDSLTAKGEAMAKQRLLEVKRDIRYFSAQVERATLVDPAGQPRDEVRFGAVVTMRDGQGKNHVFQIVGDDEADVAAGSISWASPLAKAMLGARVGDTVKWQRPAGTSEVEIVAIAYLETTAAVRTP